MATVQASLSTRPANPFPVYPVQPIGELVDVRAATVETPEVKIVRDSVIEFAKSFGKQAGTAPRHLVLAVKGDFGTGKTHLMLYARSLLEAETNIFQSPPSTLSQVPQEASSERVRSLLCVASEMTIEDWYTSLVGPALIKSVQPRELVRELMTDVACRVAEESPLTEPLAIKFRQSRQALFQALRNADEIDASKIEGKFSDLLTELAPDADDSFRQVLSALRWTETAPLAERWLAGGSIEADQEKRLGLSGADNLSVRAATVITTMAAICRHLSRPFALFVDEFEHLARHDRRHQSRRNVTWVKRLVEVLSRRNAMVFISGHWEAWEQQGDFLDRFMGRPPLQLVRLDTNDILKIVNVLAPDWSRLFEKNAAASLADVTAGNIRRVMTVLYDLYARTAGSDSPITPQIVIEIASQRLHRGPEEGFLPIVEQAVRAQGGIIERDIILSGRRVDAIARLDAEPRLLISIVHARDEAALLAAGEQLADLVRATRREAPRVRGLFIAVGAVNPEHLRTLDAARSELDAVNGEASEVGPAVARLVAAALSAAPAPAEPSGEKAVEELREELLLLRRELLDSADAQVSRGKKVFASDDRSLAVGGTIVPDNDELARQRADLEKRQVADRIMAEEQRTDPLLLLSLLRSPLFLASFFPGIALLIFADDLSKAFTSGLYRGPDLQAFYSSMLVTFRFSGLLLVGMGIFFLFQNVVALVRFRRFRLLVFTNMMDDGAPIRAFRNAKATMDNAVEEVGIRHAAKWTESKLAEEGFPDHVLARR
jgi:hypothetical protein